MPGYFEWMVIDLNRRRSRAFTGLRDRKRLPFAWTVFGKFLLNWIRKRMPTDFESTRRFTATYDNIDFNKHVTQATYVRWVTNSLSYDFLKDHEITELEIIYEHEVLPDSVVCAGCHVEEAGNRVKVYHQVKNESLDKTHCFAVSYWKKR